MIMEILLVGRWINEIKIKSRLIGYSVGVGFYGQILATIKIDDLYSPE